MSYNTLKPGSGNHVILHQKASVSLIGIVRTMNYGSWVLEKKCTKSMEEKGDWPENGIFYVL